MLNSLRVGRGGFPGSAARYQLGGWLNRLAAQALFPYETRGINVAGCLAIGLLAGLSENRGILTPEGRLFLLVGVLGGFTTFSMFGYETFQLLRDGEMAASALDVALQVIPWPGGAWAGHALARLPGGGAS